MTFLEAAIELLRQARHPMSAKELAARAVEKKLLSHQGRTPEATMQARLQEELKKGPHSPLAREGSGKFTLRRWDAPARTRQKEQDQVSVSESDETDETEGETKPAAPEVAAAAGDKPKRRRRRGGRGRNKKKGEKGEAVRAEVEAGTPEEALAAEALAEEAAAAPDEPDEPDDGVAPAPSAAPAAQPRDDAAPIDLDAFAPPQARRHVHVADLSSEENLAKEYADEISGGGVTAPVEGEVVDSQTADEDRPMLAEIGGRDRKWDRGKRRGRGREREREQKPQRGERDHKERGHKQAQPAQPQPQAQPAQPQPQPQGSGQPQPQPQVGKEPTGLVEAAYQVLRASNDPRPIHTRQLAAMAVKRRLVAGDPEDLWRGMRAACLADVRARLSAGLRPRVRHHGGALFALAKVDDEVRAREEALAQRAEELAAATRAALRGRLVKLPAAAFEQLVRVYLERTGWRDVERIKRSDENWYLSATARRGIHSVRCLVAVRPGGGEIGRRAVGELRAGVTAKQLDEGVLFAAARLGPEGERELAAAGPRVSVWDGAALADELVRAGVGVLRLSLPVSYLDGDFLADLVES